MSQVPFVEEACLTYIRPDFFVLYDLLSSFHVKIVDLPDSFDVNEVDLIF